MKLRTRLGFILAIGTNFLLGSIVQGQVSPASQPVLPLAPGEPTEVVPFPQVSPGNTLSERVPLMPAPPGTYVSPWLMDVVKLVRARIDDAVIVTFIDSAGTFSLDAEKIIFLRDLGLSGEIVALMIQHDAEIVAGIRRIPPAPSASPATMTFSFSNPAKAVTKPTASTNSSIIQAVQPKVSAPTQVRQDIQPNPTVSAEEVFASEFPPSPVKTPALPSAAWPVRQPYAVQLLDPIIMVRAPGIVPNVTVIDFAR